MKKGDIFSEVSHYIALNDYQVGTHNNLYHVESGEQVSLSDVYMENLLKTADSFNSIIKVGKEDKFWTKKQIEEGISKGHFAADPIPNVEDIRIKGIRTIWEELVSAHVFTVGFFKADTNKTKKAFQAELESQQEYAVALIDKAKKDKKSMAEAYKIALGHVQANPIVDYIPGELRVLRGYKTQFVSRDGKYDCIDMDLLHSTTPYTYASSIRPVNINTIQFLVFNGVKYEVE